MTTGERESAKARERENDREKFVSAGGGRDNILRIRQAGSVLFSFYILILCYF